MSLNKDGNNLLYKIALVTSPSDNPFNIGPKIFPVHIIVNLQKGSTIIMMYLLMIYFNNYSKGAYIYLSLHGSYGLIWLLKDITFPDKSMHVKTCLLPAGALVTLLLLYWCMGFEMMLGWGIQEPSNGRIFVCFFLYSFGLIFMLCTDLQKYLILQYKKGLITNYFLASNRNTNYLGEIMIYFSFALIVGRLECYLLLIFVWMTFFVGRIYLKEKSLQKKEGFDIYKNNSYIILFKFFDSHLINGIIYAFIISLLFCILKYF
jgi:protein-S-isoprenylcysteine O-methyltransferase Ste14